MEISISCTTVSSAHPSAQRLFPLGRSSLGRVRWGFREPPRLKSRLRSVDRASKALRSEANLLSAGAEAEAIRTGDEIFYDLPITYTKGTIYNPATDKHDNVCLRSYDDEFLAPTIVMKPGQTVRY